MNLSPVPADVAHAGLRVLKTVCLSREDASRSALQFQFLEAVQTYILKSNFELESLTPITPKELAKSVSQPEFRNRIIRAAIIAAAIDGGVDKSEVQAIESFASELEVDLAPVRAAWKLAKNQLLLARIDIVRKSLPGFKIKELLARDGFKAVVEQFFPLAGIELPKVTERYKNLFTYPAGTLGKEFTHYIERNHFPLPGQKGAGPEIIVTHDCLHILGDYGTTAPEEIEVASFQAGCHSQDPIYGLLFGLAQYHLGIQVAPVAPAEKLQANPARIVAAFARGCRVKKDMWADFKPWDYFDQNIEDLRQEFGIDPKE